MTPQDQVSAIIRACNAIGCKVKRVRWSKSHDVTRYFITDAEGIQIGRISLTPQSGDSPIWLKLYGEKIERYPVPRGASNGNRPLADYAFPYFVINCAYEGMPVPDKSWLPELELHYIAAQELRKKEYWKERTRLNDIRVASGKEPKPFKFTWSNKYRWMLGRLLNGKFSPAVETIPNIPY